MGATPVSQVTAAGILRPDFPTCLTYQQGAIRAIYGQDLVLSPDTQDGQFMALLANSYHDCNGQAVAAYNAYSPSTAIGEGLSRVVKINGIRRKIATASTVDFLSIGWVGITITGGQVRDPNGVVWTLPDHTIPPSGQILVTSTCDMLGAVALAAGAVDTLNGAGSIVNPTQGWQAVMNPSAATPGLPVETDAQLRRRQAVSTALPAETIIESLWGALLALGGVTGVRIVENDQPAVDTVNGLPGNTIACVVEGGDAAVIADLIRRKKSPGVGTYGDTLTVLLDAYGIPKPIRFFRPRLTAVAWYVTLKPKAGYTTDVRDTIKANLAGTVNGLGIGIPQQMHNAYPAALLTGDPRASSFELVDLKVQRRDMSSDNYGDINVAFNERLTCDLSDVAVTLVSTT